MMSWVCVLYVLLLVVIAAARTVQGWKVLRLVLEFVVLPIAAALAALAVLGLIFGL